MIYTDEAELRAFMMMAMTLPDGPTLELCYYDKLNRQFFQVNNFDLLMADDAFDEQFTTGYTSEEQQVLTSYVRRLLSNDESEDSNLIPIQRLELTELLRMQEMFVGGTLLEPEGELMKLIIGQRENEVFAIEPALQSRRDTQLWQQWEDFKISMLNVHVKGFVKQHGIDLSQSVLYYIEPQHKQFCKRDEVNLQPEESMPVNISERPWWKRWLLITF